VQAGDAGLPGFPVFEDHMQQVSVRDTRAADRGWIQSVYRDYLLDLAPAATGLYPMLPDIAQREPDQWTSFFADSAARALTLCYDEQPVGFAKISVHAAPAGSPARRASPAAATAGAGDYSMAEFFVARSWRRRGIGAQAVRLILDRFEGQWLITEHLRNEAAVKFWRQVVSRYTDGRYQERIVNGEVQQRFESRRRR